MSKLNWLAEQLFICIHSNETIEGPWKLVSSFAPSQGTDDSHRSGAGDSTGSLIKVGQVRRRALFCGVRLMAPASPQLADPPQTYEPLAQCLAGDCWELGVEVSTRHAACHYEWLWRV